MRYLILPIMVVSAIVQCEEPVPQKPWRQFTKPVPPLTIEDHMHIHSLTYEEAVELREKQ